MEKDNNINKLDALKRRRELLASLAARRRLNILSSSTPKQFEEGNAVIATNANAKQVTSFHSNSSDIIEDSDIENDYHENSNKTRVVNSSGNSNDSCSTSTFCLPLAHAFFASPHKLDESTSLQPTKRKPKISIISEVIIAPPVTAASSSIAHASSNDPADRSPKMLHLIANSEIEMLTDTQRLQHVSPPTCETIRLNTTPETKKCVLETTLQDTSRHSIALVSATNVVTSLSPEVKQGILGAEPEGTPQHSAKAKPDVNIDLSPQKTIHTIKEPTPPIADTIALINTSPDVQNITANLQDTFHLDTDIDTRGNSPPIMHEMSIPNGNQPPVALSPLSSDHTVMCEPIPGPSSENRFCSRIEDIPKGRKRYFRQTINKAHVDYLSDEEQKDFSAGSSDLWSSGESDTSSGSMDKKKRKKKTKKVKVIDKEVEDKEAATLIKKKEKRRNANKLRKKNRAEGKTYQTKSGVTVDERKMKGNPCVENKCIKRCFEITEERRKSIFDHFWNLDSQRRRDWILRCIQRVAIKRKRTSTPESRRTATYEYFINDGEDHRKVCQKFLIHTLDITQKYLTYTIQNSEMDMAKQDNRKPNVPQKYSEAVKAYVEDFIKKLPVLPSHYNRPKTDRMYLPQEYKSTMHIYRKYLNDCKINGYQSVSEAIFRQIFNEYNISIHVPKKDKCTICTKFENNKETATESNKEPVKDEKLQAHLDEKNATYRRFKSHQNIKFHNDTITTSFDLQKVLNTPYGESMLLYYSRKYTVYNFTLYESGTQDVFCFTWGESDGNRGSNEIATCLLKYLKDIDSRGVKNLLLYCDSCSGQNKNKTVLAALNWFLKTSNNLEVIQINFLLPGHTYMPVDSVHAVIEREVKKLIVWSPSQWPTYFQSARKNPRPYRVEVLDHTDFLDFEAVAETTFTPSVAKKVRISQIRIATFKKKYPDQVRLKYSMFEEAEEIRVTLHEEDLKTKNVKGKGKRTEKSKGKAKGKGKSKANTNNTQDTFDDSRQHNPGPMITPAYNARLPISKAKYKDLKRLCDNGTIPKTYHNEYLRIPYEDMVCDYFPHSDDEEDEEINED